MQDGFVSPTAVVEDIHNTESSGGVSGSSFADMFIENELLDYTSFYRDRVSSEALRSTLLAFYSPDDITAAKKVYLSPSFIGSLAAAC